MKQKINIKNTIRKFLKIEIYKTKKAMQKLKTKNNIQINNLLKKQKPRFFI